MQTFVTYHSHVKTARDLDTARLGKQRVEVLQILAALYGETEAYRNHPAVRMWEGYEAHLIIYGLVICHEWRIVRKHDDSTWGNLSAYAKEFDMEYANQYPPPWLADKWVLRSHRSNLMRKDPRHYAKYAGTPENMPYLWPVLNDDGPYHLRVSKPDMVRLNRGERELPEGLLLCDSIVTEDR